MKTFLRILLGLLFCFTFRSTYAQGPGNSLQFNGYDDYVDCSNQNRGITNSVTVEAWVKTNSAKYHWILGKYDRYSDRGYHLIIKYGKAAFAGRDGSGLYRNSGYSNDNVNDNNWHHLVGVCTKGTWQIYVNGILQSQEVTGYQDTDLTNTAPMALGKDFISDNENFSGTEDEVRVWNRALTQEEIRQRMCHKLTASEPGLVAYFNFDNTSGYSVTDHSPLHINGTFRNMNPATAWTLSGAPVGDKSVYLYPSNWATPLRLPTGLATFSVVQADKAIKGMHLYQVASAPNSVSGISNPAEVKEYYGVYKVGGATGKYKLCLEQSAISCKSTLFNRQDNTDATWSVAADTTLSSVLLKTESAAYGEYVVNNSFAGAININGPATICSGSTAVLSVTASGKVTWSTGATGNSIQITKGGQYEAIVEENGCISRGTLVVKEVAPPILDLGPDRIVCPNETFVLSAPKGNPEYYSYLWSTGATTASIAITQPGTYTLTATNTAGCSTTDELVVTKHSVPAYVFPEEVTTCYGEKITIGAEVAGATYRWSTGQTTQTINVSTPGAYQVFYTVYGCTYNFTITVVAEECPEIPNIITPNGDGKNDAFVLKGIEQHTTRLEIFNRWGKSVFQSESYGNDWSAAGVPTGMYYYQFTSRSTGKVYKGWLEVAK
ncbi:LamG-like jellyroll fold domain-containing protein [Pontibacter liquoris]|uniref:LamG-like jellyroll fold domain-containing protein n=1 Tax=Pontibacter liquoris TaxID=2905677 RepID=UPI001FA759E3|nr:LamG-like jellyroll fold domain-containing protein [Pontibacter liquoris]